MPLHVLEMTKHLASPCLLTKLLVPSPRKRRLLALHNSAGAYEARAEHTECTERTERRDIPSIPTYTEYADCTVRYHTLATDLAVVKDRTFMGNIVSILELYPLCVAPSLPPSLTHSLPSFLASFQRPWPLGTLQVSRHLKGNQIVPIQTNMTKAVILCVQFRPLIVNNAKQTPKVPPET